MSLRDNIADIWTGSSPVGTEAADAILALVRAHLTSDDPHVMPLYASPPAPETP